MKKLSLNFVVFIVMLIAPIWGFCQQQANDLVQNIGSGNINWTNGVIRAKGIGAPPEKYYGKPHARPMALRAAVIVARRNLLEVVKGVRIDSRTLVKDFVVESDIIKSEVSGVVRNSRIVKQEYMSDGTVEVIVEMSLTGDFSQNIFDNDKNITFEAPPARSPQPPTRPSHPAPQQAVYTGLVVNAKGINARPAMAPKIVDEDGKEVYGSAYVSREYAIQQGMTGYSKDLATVQKNPRVTDNPILVRGLRTDGSGRSNIVIANADAEKLRQASDALSFLKKCRVMIVVD